MSGGAQHQHITAVRWERAEGPKMIGESARSAIVDWITRNGGEARVRDGKGYAIEVRVVDADPPHIRTYAEGTWTDDLLDLPRY